MTPYLNYICTNLFYFFSTNIAIAAISSYITLWLSDRKENRAALVRFKNRLISVAYELQYNFRYVGNHQNPFQTKALEKLVYDEPLIHQYPELLIKAQKCLNTALLLSSSQQPIIKPGEGQNLMMDLSEYLKNYHAIKINK